MNLENRKLLASKVLGVGKRRIIFESSMLPEIKEALTRQDIRDMHAEGIIRIAELSGRRKKEKRTTRRGVGKIKFKIKPGKREHVILIRKLRRYINELKKQNKVSPDKHMELRKMIKSRAFKNKAHLKERLEAKK